MGMMGWMMGLVAMWFMMFGGMSLLPFGIASQ